MRTMRTVNKEKEAANVLNENQKVNSAVKNGKKGKRAILLISLIVAICIVSSVAVYAAIQYANSRTATVTDTFKPAQVSCKVEVIGNVYTVTNTSDITVYVRVFVDADWVSTSDSSLHWTSPTVSVTADENDWTKSDDYYYYNTPVPPNGTAKITVANGGSTAPDGYKFSAKVNAEVIQSDPVTAAQDAWGYTFGG